VDIAEQKAMERALGRQELEYRTLIHQQSELLVRVDAFTDLLGYTIAEMPDSAHGLPMSVVVTVWVLVNELAMNAMKRGFDSSTSPVYTVSSKIVGQGNGDRSSQIVLTVSKNGRTFSTNIDLETSTSLGLQLVRSLVAQLNGRLELTRAPETAFTITFPFY
jgi:two-component sensor histidine kinase